MNQSIRIIVLILFGILNYSYGVRDCGHGEYMNNLFLSNPGLKEQLMRENSLLEVEVQNNTRSIQERRQQTVYTIPVVVHIIYNTAAQNIPDEVIEDQIARLNVDYRKLNDQSSTVAQFQSLEADSYIQFVLANTNPNGDATNGITRTSTAVAAFPNPSSPSFNHGCQESSKGGKDIWNRDRYMNVWVCNMQGDTLGFAQSPGGPAQWDGIVINTKAFGAGSNAISPYNKGRTLTHEVGHWFNLDHPWGDNEGDCTEDDQVSDTPQTSQPNYECDLTHRSCGTLDMVQNYMDYPSDACMTLFTVGQVARMRAQFVGTGRRVNLPLGSYTGTPPGTDGTYVSPYDDEVDQGSDIDLVSKLNFTSGTIFYVIIAIACFVGIFICCAFVVSVRRCVSKK